MQVVLDCYPDVDGSTGSTSHDFASIGLKALLKTLSFFAIPEAHWPPALRLASRAASDCIRLKSWADRVICEAAEVRPLLMVHATVAASHDSVNIQVAWLAEASKHRFKACLIAASELLMA